MKIYFTGHAGFLIQDKETNIVIDPWFSKKGAFLRSWYQFPKNHHMTDFVIQKLIEKKNNYVFVTHDHEDHFDAETLTTLSKYCDNLIVPDFKNKSLLSMAKKLKFKNLKCLGEEENNLIGDLRINIFIQETAINIDSAILVTDSDGYRFLNLNDCKVHDRVDYISEKYKNINILTQQFSGASMHPVTYDYDSAKYKKITNRKKLSKMKGVIDNIGTLKPQVFIPSAGPPVFLRPDLFDLNFKKDSTFSMFWEFESYFNKNNFYEDTRFLPLEPGGSIDSTSGFAEKIMKEKTANEFKKILKSYKQDFLEYDVKQTLDVSKIKKKLFKDLSDKLEPIKHFSRENFNKKDVFDIYFTPDNKTFIRVNLLNATIENVDGIDNTAYYVHFYNPFFINLVLDKHTTWSSYFLSFMFKNKRIPDKYNVLVESFLISRSAKEYNASLLEIDSLRKNEEKIEVIDKKSGVKYRCNRYCPHQGADLKYAIIENGKIVCPRHAWKFDLKNNGNCTQNNFTIKSKAIH